MTFLGSNGGVRGARWTANDAGKSGEGGGNGKVVCPLGRGEKWGIGL